MLSMSKSLLEKLFTFDNQSPDFVFEVLEIQVRGRNSLFKLNE